MPTFCGLPVTIVDTCKELSNSAIDYERTEMSPMQIQNVLKLSSLKAPNGRRLFLKLWITRTKLNTFKEGAKGRKENQDARMASH